MVGGTVLTDTDALGTESDRPGSDGGLKVASMSKSFSMDSKSFFVQGLKALQICQHSPT